jgi:hypothetical protein
MTEDNNDDLTLAEIMDFGMDRIERELDGFDGDVPNHSARLLSSYATDLLQTLVNIEVMRADDSTDSPDEEFVEDKITDDLVDILLAVAAVKYEHGVDLETAFEDHMSFVKDYQAMQEAMQDAETREEMAEVFDEHMSEHSESNPLSGMGMAAEGGIEIGDNVDDEDYDADDDRDRHIA